MPLSLISQIKKTKTIIEENKNKECIDLSKYRFIAPTTLLPLLQYMELNKITNYIPHNNTKHYLNMVLGEGRLNTNTIPLRKLKKFQGNYFQIADSIELYLSNLTDEIVDLIDSEVDTQSFNLLFYEMLDNIYKHSKFNNAYVLCQKYPYVNTIDICIIDDGISIPGSFEESNIKVINDSETIFEAINGETTDKEKYALHGRGLNTSVSITTLGYGEEMLIASRNGTCTITKEGVKLWDDLSFIEGTFVTLRVNTNKIKNIHNYTKRRLVKKLNDCDEVKK